MAVPILLGSLPRTSQIRILNWPPPSLSCWQFPPTSSYSLYLDPSPVFFCPMNYSSSLKIQLKCSLLQGASLTFRQSALPFLCTWYKPPAHIIASYLSLMNVSSSRRNILPTEREASILALNTVPYSQAFLMNPKMISS